MQKPTEPSSSKPVANDANSDQAEAAESESSPVEEQTTCERTHPEQEHKTPRKEPLPSEITMEAVRRDIYRGGTRVDKLMKRWAQERETEKQAEKLAQARAAEKHKLLSDDSDEEEEEEFAEEEQPESQPEQIVVTIGGLPADATDLTDIEDLVRRDGLIEVVRYASAKDGIINQFTERFALQWNLRSVYESLTLPTGVEGFRTTRRLFDDISSLLHKRVMLPTRLCSLLAYWAIATWFTEYLPFVPSVAISGPTSSADILLRTLVAVCRRPILLGELNPAVLRKLPINEITPTLLIREPQLSRYTSALLNASNQPGYLFLSGKTFQQLYCPKCIYVGEHFKDSSLTRDSVHINLGGSVWAPRQAVPTEDEITSFQNRLLCYRLVNHDKVRGAKFQVTGFRPEISIVADVLAAGVIDDVELQSGVIEVLKDRDEQSRVDRATGLNGLVLRAVLFHCHQKDERKFVREIAATANRFYAEDGESLKVSSETVGHVLKDLGLYSRRLGNAGRGLMFDKATQAHAHRLSHAYDVLIAEPSCEHCHDLQQPQSEGVVQDV